MAVGLVSYVGDALAVRVRKEDCQARVYVECNVTRIKRCCKSVCCYSCVSGRVFIFCLDIRFHAEFSALSEEWHQ